MSPTPHGLVGAYVTDALDEVERAAFEAHLVGCADCLVEVSSLREAAATISETTSTPTPLELRAQVMARIGVVRPLPPAVAPAVRSAIGPPDEVGRRRRRARVAAGLGAAAAAVVLAVGLGVARPWVSDAQPSAAQRVLQADDALRTSVDLGVDARVAVVHSESLGQSVVQTEGLTPAAAGSVYQLWLSVDGELVSAGLMPSDARDRTVRLQGDSREATAVAITVEPAGGSSTPTTEPIAMLDFGPGA